MKIIFVTGKGGVGKSTVAASIAKAKAKTYKTLLVELGTRSFYQDFLSLPEVGYQPQSTHFGFSVSLWSGPECLKEYAKHLLKIESLYRLFFENKVMKSLIQAAPALPELAVMGKITSGPPRNIGPQLPFEVIVVDGFSTGHFLSLLKAPLAMAEVVSFGPMGEQSRSIDRLLRDPKMTEYVLVTTAEELPLKESTEFEEKLFDFIKFKPQWIINKRINPTFQHASQNPNNHKFEEKILEINQNQKNILLKYTKNKNPLEIPFVFSHQAKEILEEAEKIFK